MLARIEVHAAHERQENRAGRAGRLGIPALPARSALPARRLSGKRTEQAGQVYYIYE